MRARLAGKASEALAEQRARLEADAREAARQALLNRFGVAGDSSATKLPLTGTAARESVSSAARGLLKSFFGARKTKPTSAVPAPAPAPLPPPATTPAPVPVAVPDTTQH
jgi:hypothetical protein